MKKKRNNLVRYSMLFVAIFMIGFGIYLQQPQQVFAQAIRICLECIGIG